MIEQHSVARRDGRSRLLAEPYDDFLADAAIDVHELVPLRDRAVPVSFLRQKFFKVWYFFERNQPRITTCCATFQTPFFFLLPACQRHRPFGFRLTHSYVEIRTFSYIRAIPSKIFVQSAHFCT